jgi:predicted glycoside hydrolase/deacetylase ChbG (UPF0249 family)
MNLPLINADDWGLSPGINEGILDLVRRGIVRRVSILASGSFVSCGLAELKTLPALTLGLHFSLTFGETQLGDQIRNLAMGGRFHLSPFRVALLYLLASPYKRKQLGREVNLLVREQLATLKAHGVCPTHLDGHHHIHLVPGVLESMLPALQEAGITQVRVSWDPARLLSRVSPAVILALRARLKWRKWGVTFLPCVYPAARNYRNETLLRRRMARTGGYEMVVHPAARDDVPELRISDHYAGNRVLEYQVLRSLEPLFSHEKGQP